jgi:hypothetical protein
MTNPTHQSEVRKQVYHKLDHLAEGAHRAFNDVVYRLGRAIH